MLCIAVIYLTFAYYVNCNPTTVEVENATSAQGIIEVTSTSSTTLANNQTIIQLPNSTFNALQERGDWSIIIPLADVDIGKGTAERVEQFAGDQLKQGNVVITVINYCGSAIDLQCRSPKKDLGSRILADQHGFAFSFDPAEETSNYFCHAWWKDMHKEFIVYKTDTTTENNVWKLYGYGIFLEDEKFFDWEKMPVVHVQ